MFEECEPTEISVRLFRRNDEQRNLQARRLSGQDDQGGAAMASDPTGSIDIIEKCVLKTNDELDQIVGRLDGLVARTQALNEIDLTLDPTRCAGKAGSVETLDLRTLMAVRDPNEEQDDDFDQRFDAFARSENDQPARRWLEGF